MVLDKMTLIIRKSNNDGNIVRGILLQKVSLAIYSSTSGTCLSLSLTLRNKMYHASSPYLLSSSSS